MLPKNQRIKSLNEKLKRERERHYAALKKISADRMLAATITDAAKKGARFAALSARSFDEASRHREAVADLNRRLRDARSS